MRAMVLDEHTKYCAIISKCDLKNFSCDLRLNQLIEAMQHTRKKLNDKENSTEIASLQRLEKLAASAASLGYDGSKESIDKCSKLMSKIEKILQVNTYVMSVATFGSRIYKVVRISVTARESWTQWLTLAPH